MKWRLLDLFSKNHNPPNPVVEQEKLPTSMVGAKMLLNQLKDPQLQKVLKQGAKLHVEEQGDLAAGVNAGMKGTANVGANVSQAAGYKIDIEITPKNNN